MLKLEETKEYLKSNKRLKSGRFMAFVAINHEELFDIKNKDITDMLGISPTSASDVSKAKNMVDQLGKMGYEIRER